MPAESALIVAVPEAEALVGGFRERYDPAASAGVPAHITVLYPFLPPHRLTPEILHALAALFARIPCFAMTLNEVRRFPDVLYLAPEPANALRELVIAVAERFPETPPYGGLFPDIIPHLTFAHPRNGRSLDDIAEEFDAVAAGQLPIRARVAEVTLMVNTAGLWEFRERFPLARRELPAM